MSYKVISRKWRPQRFEDVIGQNHITVTLKNAIKTDRVAHAYLFTGPRGIGKTSTARILAKALNCEKPLDFNPCNECIYCREITESNSLDVFEIDGASNRGIDEIRNLRESVKYPPQSAKYKIYIIDEVHMLTREAFNALLKTLEEPPPQVFFIFATTEPMKVPATIISRCQRFDFRRIPVSEVVRQLKKITETEKIDISEEALIMLARKGEGSMRDSESLLDQTIAFCGDKISTEDVIQILGVIDYSLFFEVSKYIREKSSGDIISTVDNIRDRGYDLNEFIEGLTEHFRNLLVVKVMGSSDSLDLPQNIRDDYLKIASEWNDRDLVQIIQILSDAGVQLRTLHNPVVYTELILLKLAMLDKAVSIDDLLKKLMTPGKIPEISPGENLNLFSTGKGLKESPAKASEKTRLKTVKEPVPGDEKVSEDKPEPAKHLTIGEIRKVWSNFISYVEEKNITLGSFFAHAFPQKFSDPILEIGFDPRKEFEFLNVKKRQSNLEALAHQFFGRPIQIKCLHSEGEREVDIDKEDHKDPITSKIIELFDGEVIKERKGK